MKKIFFLLLFLFPVLLLAQSSFSGIIKDSKTKAPLPFATIITDRGIGEVSDSDGKFVIQSKNTITELTVSYVGYKPQKISINTATNFITVLLEPSEESLNEIILIAKENPALRIIRAAIANKKKNNILKNLNSFKYTSYNKFLVTANPDSIQGTVDSIFVLRKGKKVFKKVDSSNYEFKKQIAKSHIYLSEKISEHKFQRGKNKKETILASRMAGFKNPVYEFLALDIENFTFYEEVYTLLGNKYINPLAKNALKNYNYKILDTVVHKKDSTFMIYFKPKKKRETVGLEGVLYLNSKQWALEKGIAQLKGIVSVKAVQTFSYKPTHNIWFPVETAISLRKGKNKEKVKLFGAVTFSSGQENDSIVKTNKKDPGDVSYLLSKTKNFDITINTPVKVINSASIIEIDEDAASKDAAFWNRYRTDSITKRGLETYKRIDSISKEEGVEKKLNIARKIFKGYLPSKYFDINLSQVINFNNYEGFRIGLGAITNTNFSKKIKLDTYAAYGFNDQVVKYHLGASFRLNRNNNTWLGAAYTDDLQEAAKIDFLFDETSFSLINPRNLNISQFYGFKEFAVNFKHDIFPNLESKLKLSHGRFDTKFNYQYNNGNTSFINNFKLTQATLAIRWTPFSTYMNSPIGKITVKRGYPKVTSELSKNFSFLDGNFDFTKFSMRIEHKIQLLHNSSTTFLVQGGMIFGDAPLTHLYNATPNYSFANPWIRRVNFSGTNAFETMAFNEFISDRYISIQARHNFPRIKITSFFRPRISFITRFAIGDINNAQDHSVEFKSMNKGYFESGMVLNHLFKGFGLSAFYRYGSYANTNFSDNLAVKLTYVFSLGF